MEDGELGCLPASMGNDLRDLKAEFASEIWEALKPDARKLFNLIVIHFEERANYLWRLQRIFREKRTLTPADIDTNMMGRESLSGKFRQVTGLE
jgi:hypothetical protein